MVVATQIEPDQSRTGRSKHRRRLCSGLRSTPAAIFWNPLQHYLESARSCWRGSGSRRRLLELGERRRRRLGKTPGVLDNLRAHYVAKVDAVEVAHCSDVQPTAVEQGADRVAGLEPCSSDVERDRRSRDVGNDQVEDRREMIGETKPMYAPTSLAVVGCEQIFLPIPTKDYPRVLAFSTSNSAFVQRPLTADTSPPINDPEPVQLRRNEAVFGLIRECRLVA